MNINIKTYVVFFILVFALSACKTTSGTKWIEIDQEPLTDNEKTEFKGGLRTYLNLIFKPF